MYLKSIELIGFKSFGKKSELRFTSPIASIVGPNGSGKSNVAEAFRFVLGEQSMKSLRSKRGEDLIWGGSPALPRQNRASVRVTFDNVPDREGKRLLDIDFNEVVIERVVHRDGQNEYMLNGSSVRLKDVVRLLAGANIGGSGYQIISQGEADRILNASPKERREMVEDALGLKLYQHKKAESEKKLEETAINIDKTKSLRRELAPHINFLRQQVEKIEKAREMKEELAVRMNDYLAREHAWITQEDARLLDELRACESEIQALEAQALLGEQETGSPASTQHLEDKIRRAEEELATARNESARLVRDLGRAEGALEVRHTAPVEHAISSGKVRSFVEQLHAIFERSEHAEDIQSVRSHIVEARSHIAAFIAELELGAPHERSSDTNEAARAHLAEIAHALEAAQAREAHAVDSVAALRKELLANRTEAIAHARKGAEAHALVREARTRMSFLQSERARIREARERFEEEVREGIILIGAAIHGWEHEEIPQGALSEERSMQEKRRRDMERLKIKIEEAGAGDSEAIMREFSDTRARDEFLARELGDLERSAEALHGIIAELEETIDKRFIEGLSLINTALQSFFSKLFNGGTAALAVEEPRRAGRTTSREDDEEGIDGPSEESPFSGLTVSVSLPRKKVRGLEVLSGGERALTSIAMIFAMSRVNPPPFLILDETDAALDEANSRRYADMIRELGAHSQLIVITHNRATMAAAGELYGVTMGQDGVSKLLSVKLEEAERVAK